VATGLEIIIVTHWQTHSDTVSVRGHSELLRGQS
jgi:hypothetical protein